jgi:hypothetical protein
MEIWIFSNFLAYTIKLFTVCNFCMIISWSVVIVSHVLSNLTHVDKAGAYLRGAPFGSTLLGTQAPSLARKL